MRIAWMDHASGSSIAINLEYVVRCSPGPDNKQTFVWLVNSTESITVNVNFWDFVDILSGKKEIK